MGISAALHVAVLGIRLDGPSRPRGGVAAKPTDATTFGGLHVLDIVTADPDVAAPGVAPATEAPTSERATAPPAVPTLIETVDREPAPAAERLGVPERDERLLGPATDPLGGDVDPLQVERATLLGLMEAYHDSTVSAAAAPRPTDWSLGVADGGRVSLTPGRIQIGDRALVYCRGVYSPSDCGFGSTPGKLESARNALRTFGEVQRQAARMDIENGWRERAAAIRLRNDAARDSTRTRGGA
mgnify:CR=1 FL=1